MAETNTRDPIDGAAAISALVMLFSVRSRREMHVPTKDLVKFHARFFRDCLNEWLNSGLGIDNWYWAAGLDSDRALHKLGIESLSELLEDSGQS